jgi:gliding motility-associated-like protein
MKKFRLTFKLILCFIITSLILLDAAGFVSLSNAGTTANINIKVIIIPDTFPPAPVTDLEATSGVTEGSINLSWTAPAEDGTMGGGAVSSYVLKYATFSVNDLAGDTTAWWNHPQTLTALDGGSPKEPGETETFIIGGLSPGTTFYFAIKSRDDQGQISPIDTKTASLNQANAVARSVAPAAITDLVAIPGAGNDRVDLSWTAPGDDGWLGMATKYIIKYATYTINADNFESLTDVKERNVTVSGGNPDSGTITGLASDTLYYFAIKTEDEVPNVSDISNIASATTRDNIPPAPPTGLVANGRDRKVDLQWIANSEPDLAGYNVYRSTYSMGYSTIPINTSLITSLSYQDVGLSNGTTYYYVITALDTSGNESNYSNEVSAVPRDTLPPREPAGIKGILSADGKTMTISWSAVSKNEDGTSCNDLAGYSIYRASALDGEYTLAGFVAGGESLVWTDPENIQGRTFYYMVRTKDTSGNLSRISMIADSSEDLNIIAVDEENMSTRIVISKEINQSLYKESNSYGDDVIIEVSRNKEEENGRVIKSYSFIATKGQSGEELKNFVFSKPLAKIVLAYEVENGHVKRASSVPADRASEQLALFWFNGLEWIKLGGEVDESLHQVMIKSKRIGKYMIKESLRATLFVIEGIQPDKIFTPNGDGWNDYFEIQYANPKDGTVKGRIYDPRGALVAEMGKGATENSLRWEGKDRNGNPAPGGVYIYQIQVTGPENKVINGTVVVAR